MGSPVVWFEMHAVDVDKAREFYAMLFGWQFAALDGSGPDDYWLISTTEGTVSGGMTMLEGGRPGDNVVLYVQVESLDGAIESALLLGGSVEQGPTPINPEAGSYALLRDPNGAMFGLWSRESGEDPAP